MTKSKNIRGKKTRGLTGTRHARDFGEIFQNKSPKTRGKFSRDKLAPSILGSESDGRCKTGTLREGKRGIKIGNKNRETKPETERATYFLFSQLKVCVCLFPSTNPLPSLFSLSLLLDSAGIKSLSQTQKIL